MNSYPKMARGVTTQIFSLPGLILADIAKAKEQDKKFKDLKKSLKKNYSVDKVADLQKKYMKKPTEFSANFAVLVDSFVKEYTLFREAYGELLRLIVETGEAAQKQTYSEVISLEEMIERVEARAQQKPGEFYFPEKAQKAFAKELKRALEKLAAQLQTDYDNLEGLKKGKKYVMGFFSRFVSSKSAERKGMKAAGKVREQIDHVTQVAAHLQLELEQGVQQDFLILFLQYVTELEKTDDLFKQLKDDLEEIMQNIEQELEDVIIKIAPFMALIQNNPQSAGKIAAAREAFQELQLQIRNGLGSEEKGDLATDAVVVKLNQSQKTLVATLAGIAKGAVDEIVKSVLGKELGR